MALRFEDIHNKIESGEYKLAVNNKSTRSTVWRVYRKIEKDDGSFLEHVLFCIGCQSLMSFPHKTTTNLRRHRCHLQYLKNQSFDGYNYNSSSESECKKRKVRSKAMEEQEDQLSLSDEMESKPAAADVAAFVVGVASGKNSPAASIRAQLPDIPEIVLPVDDSGAEESDIYAKTWALEYRKLSEDQKFYAKKAIDEILVLGRLRRLTLNTVPTT
ncbi:uncharacterized protein LOC128260187 [Drosophila gunungcola]|uniref:uncharacterized protein LOC128260187 n=1 Tax=Drosophila gunungcola TaxID=103775 RepID=UPI0022E42994|nr:uncharacterized protein LOC128260187 [Drosophila gunungcola]